MLPLCYMPRCQHLQAYLHLPDPGPPVVLLLLCSSKYIILWMCFPCRAEGGVIDAAVLDSVELGPVRAKAASIIVQGPGSQPGTRAGHAGGQRTAKGASMQLVLQLPSPRSHAVSTGCGHVAAQQQQQGDAVWDKLVKTHLALPQQQQQSRSAPVPTARKQQGKVRTEFIQNAAV